MKHLSLRAKRYAKIAELHMNARDVWHTKTIHPNMYTFVYIVTMFDGVAAHGLSKPRHIRVPKRTYIGTSVLIGKFWEFLEKSGRKWENHLNSRTLNGKCGF